MELTTNKQTKCFQPHPHTPFKSEFKVEFKKCGNFEIIL